MREQQDDRAGSKVTQETHGVNVKKECCDNLVKLDPKLAHVPQSNDTINFVIIFSTKHK